MAFDSSVISKNIDLGNGRRFIIEVHVTAGKSLELRYEAESGLDVDAKLIEHAKSLWQQMADAEIEEILNG